MPGRKADHTAIVYKDYIIEPCIEARDHFNLFRAGENQKTGKPTKRALGYGYRFENAIQRIVAEELSENHDITTIEGYITEYKKQVEIIENLIK